MKNTFATADKDSLDENFWNTINSLGDHNWFADSGDALFEAKAERTGEREIVAGGKMALTEISFESGETGYLIEDLRNE